MPDTSRQITPRSPLVALTAFRISRPIGSHRFREAARPELSFPMVDKAPVSRSHSLSVLLALALLAALIGRGPTPSIGDQEGDQL